jgi:hypothetical protein
MPKEVRFEISKKLMDLSIDMVKAIDIAEGKNITIGDLTLAGFGIPTSKLKCLSDRIVIPPTETKLIDYLEYYRYLLLENISEIKKEAEVTA